MSCQTYQKNKNLKGVGIDRDRALVCPMEQMCDASSLLVFWSLCNVLSVMSLSDFSAGKVRGGFGRLH